MIRPLLTAALLGAAVLTLAACGGDPAATASGTRPENDDELRRAQVKFAQCMRENGVEMPDPKPGGEQVFKVGGDSGISPAAFERASKACEEYREQLRPDLSEEEKQEFKTRALAHARCMRERGIDFPDPTFNADGGAEIHVGRGGADPDDPDFQAAQKACGDKLRMQDDAP